MARKLKTFKTRPAPFHPNLKKKDGGYYEPQFRKRSAPYNGKRINRS